MSEYLNYVTLIQARMALSGLSKQAFVPMPGGQAEPVAGASPMTAGMTAPMGSPPQQGGPAPGGPAPGGPPMGGPPMAPQMGGGQTVPPEVANDPQVQQMLAQAGIVYDPQSGMFIDQQAGQPIPTEQILPIIQQMMAQGGAPPPGAEMGPPPGAEMGPPPGAEMGPPPQPEGVPPEILNTIDKAVQDSIKKAMGGQDTMDVKHMIAKYEADLKGVNDQLADLSAEVSRMAEALEGLTGV